MQIAGSLLGIIAGIFTALSYFLQAIKTCYADNFSSTWIMVLCAILTLWISYGIYINDTIVMLFNMLGLIQLLTIAFVKLSTIAGMETTYEDIGEKSLVQQRL
jgi:uncharacterized protein with PQ loop repeat